MELKIRLFQSAKRVEFTFQKEKCLVERRASDVMLLSMAMFASLIIAALQDYSHFVWP